MADLSANTGANSTSRPEPVASGRPNRPSKPPLICNTTVSLAFNLPEGDDQRVNVGLPPNDDSPCSVMIELNLQHALGLAGATKQFEKLWTTLPPAISSRKYLVISDTYVRCDLSVDEVRMLAEADEQQAGGNRRERSIYQIWPDFPVRPQVDRSVSTIKGDAARRSYDATGGRHYLGGHRHGDRRHASPL